MKNIINPDGLELFTKEDHQRGAGAYCSVVGGVYESRTAMFRALGLKHPAVVEYETREAVREATRRAGAIRVWVDTHYPALPDPRIPKCKPREVTFSTGWKARRRVAVPGDRDAWTEWSKIGQWGKIDQLDYALATPDDFELYADLLRNPWQ